MCRTRIVVAAAVVAFAPAAYAQRAPSAANYPVKPIRVIVPFAPGGPNDMLARLVGHKLTDRWGQQLIVDSRPGGGTVVGTDIASKAPPDAYTLLMVSLATAVNVTLKKNLPYDTVKAFAPVIEIAASPNLLVTHPSLPVRSVADLLRLAKSRPGEIAYASGGVGGATHLGGELLCLMSGVKMTHVPYKGATPATTDLLGGHVSWMFVSVLPAVPQIRAGKLRALGVSGSRRSQALPEVPTVAETLPGFEATSWYGLFAPAGTPRDIIDKLNGEIARALTSADVREQLQREGADPVGESPERFDAHFKSEMAKWGKVIRSAKISGD
jgi:tripartite-type tricarboxylate transporter receptor subunit TctC